MIWENRKNIEAVTLQSFEEKRAILAQWFQGAGTAPRFAEPQGGGLFRGWGGGRRPAASFCGNHGVSRNKASSRPVLPRIAPLSPRPFPVVIPKKVLSKGKQATKKDKQSEKIDVGFYFQ
jgi:hypothetical protein